MSQLTFPYREFYSYAHGAFSPYEDAEPWFKKQHYRELSGRRVYVSTSASEAIEDLVTEDDLLVHGNMAPGGEIRLPSTCRYCNHRTLEEEVKLPSGSRPGAYATNFAVGIACMNCGWWKLCKYRRGEANDPWSGFSPVMTVTAYYFEGVIYAFDSHPSIRAVRAIRSQVRRRKTDLRNVSPKDLELLIGAVMSDCYDCKVHHVGGPGDGGIDLLIAEGEEPIAVQVKRRSAADATEGVSVVRHFLGSMLLEGRSKGIVVSTAREFSKDAKAAARRASELLPVQIDLYGRDKILDLLDLTPPDEAPWRRLLGAPPEEARTGATSRLRSLIRRLLHAEA